MEKTITKSEGVNKHTKGSRRSVLPRLVKTRATTISAKTSPHRDRSENGGKPDGNVDCSSITLNVASCRLEASTRRRLMLLNYVDCSQVCSPPPSLPLSIYIFNMKIYE